MKSNQKLLIMFWLRKSKATKDGTSDGRKNNLSIAQAEIDIGGYFTILQCQYQNVTPMMLKAAYNDKGGQQNNI